MHNNDRLEQLRTSFPERSFFFLPQVDSTNRFAKEAVPTHQLPALVWTDQQTQGKGQRGRTWSSQPGLNWTFSLVLPPPTPFLPSLFTLNVARVLA
ncbi:hypothetical protein RZS08_45890, partial [Arthrospira platensis SPKY1]|nr:hypothetical protein [Arthrospira platensis SPKY1]